MPKMCRLQVSANAIAIDDSFNLNCFIVVEFLPALKN